MALGDPNGIFKWENSAGLEHACWACPTKANNPRALHTCYGIHSMPCTSYHPTMHAIGSAHRCAACAMAKEMHENRHREIAELVVMYHELEDTKSKKKDRRTPLGERSPNKLTRDIPKCKGFTSDDDILERFNDIRIDENDHESCQTRLNTDMSTGIGTLPNQAVQKITRAEKTAQKREKKAERSQGKALKNQDRNFVAVTSLDVEKIAYILHGGKNEDQTAHSLATDRNIEDVIARNIKFIGHLQSHKTYLFKSIESGRTENKERKRLKRRQSKGRDEDTETEEFLNTVLGKLGIDFIASLVPPSIDVGPVHRHKRSSSTTLNSSSSGFGGTLSRPKSKQAIARKLRLLIREDLEKHENDTRQTCIRAAGFWRYVGKTVFERMTDIAADIDLRTGERWKTKMKTQPPTPRSRSQSTIDLDHKDERARIADQCNTS